MAQPWSVTAAAGPRRGGAALQARGEQGPLDGRDPFESLTRPLIPASVRGSKLAKRERGPGARRGGFRRPVAREALGLVETHGLVPAVEAADAMCKAAGVRLTRCETTREALITVTVRGPLGEVEAAVTAGAAAAARKGEVLARHVIPAPEQQLEEPIAGSPAGTATRRTDTTP